ncbi:beta-propeller domain-containing protein [Candidatus Gracilibacteria bacterium]|nr:beta-propeller domain-containing protein [Candidatus Gracilibacteria bacterium]
MKKLIILALFIISLNIANASEDNSLVNLENSGSVQNLNANFKLQKFSSCGNFEEVTKKFIKDYFEINPGGGMYRGGVMPLDDVMTVDKAADSNQGVTSEVKSPSSTVEVKPVSDYSSTNIQVAGVDESEIIKTDGKYIYFYNNKNHKVYILSKNEDEKYDIIKTINVPGSYSNPELFIGQNKLIITATKYSNANYNYYWFNRATKSIVVAYDTTDINNLKIDKFYQTDGDIMKSRKIGDYVYIISKTDFNFPYHNFYGPMIKNVQTLNDTKLNADMEAKRLLPRKSELRPTDIAREQNVSVRGKKIPYNLTSDYDSKCVDIEYLIPDRETMKKYNFTPSYVTVSAINIANPKEEIKTKLLFGDVSEIHMSTDSLYITSSLYTNYNFSCPVIQCFRAPCPTLPCAMPFYSSGENTLIHKYSINKNIISYKATTIVAGTPLNQYSMDESSGYFRIVTSVNYPERYTSLFILDKDLKVTGSLSNIAKGETFQSSRFIQDKLYLVTFQQIDQLFVINVVDPTKPEILGELKIPGYSTYLHPYNSDYLIGLGYDTKTNQWGGTQNNGVKVDLYNISDFANPKQTYTLTLGGAGSSSEALSNPRLFTWQSSKKLLFLPATLYINASDYSTSYRNIDVFQGSLAINIDKDIGIKEKARVTHIDPTGLEQERTKECATYANVDTTPECEKIIGGGEYCPPVSQYIPTYCYQSSPIGEYLANKIWDYNNSFVIRNLYLDNLWLTVSNDKIQINDTSTGFGKVGEVEMK